MNPHRHHSVPDAFSHQYLALPTPLAGGEQPMTWLALITAQIPIRKQPGQHRGAVQPHAMQALEVFNIRTHLFIPTLMLKWYVPIFHHITCSPLASWPIYCSLPRH